MSSEIAGNYQDILKDLKEKIRQARFRATFTINTQLLAIYWYVGNTILQQQNEEGWGTKIIDRLSQDLLFEFPDMKGLSVRNIKYMRAFAESYPDFELVQQSVAQSQNVPIVQRAVAQLPWGHNCVLLDKVKTLEGRLFYASKAIENGWSRDILIQQIKNNLLKRQGSAITNFDITLPKPQSDLARETLKNPYVFDFLSFGEQVQELELEKALVSHIKRFMLELGRGFAYVGNQYNLNVEGDDYFLDLLFYNYHLYCFVVFELKVGEFRPEYAGKLNFYINTIDEKIKQNKDKPTIGVLLCKTPNETVVQFALKGIKTPMGVADYELVNALPKELKSEMPSIKELEAVITEESEKLLKPSDKKFIQLKELISDLKYPEAKEERSPANIMKIFTKVFLPLKEKLIESIDEILKMFAHSEIMIWTDNKGHDSDIKAKIFLKEIKICGNFKIEVRLKGFKKAGTKAFNSWKDLFIIMEDYHYTFAMDRNFNGVISEKLYNELPTKDEINSVIEKFRESLLDSITQQVERIKNESKKQIK